jgi:hypothetical protein
VGVAVGVKVHVGGTVGVRVSVAVAVGGIEAVIRLFSSDKAMMPITRITPPPIPKVIKRARCGFMGLRPPSGLARLRVGGEGGMIVGAAD